MFSKGRVFIVLALVLGIAANTHSADNIIRKEEMPFSPGERLRYLLRWMIFPAGEGILEVLPMETIDKETTYHFRLTVSSNAFVDLFFKVRDRVDGYVNQSVTHSVRYYKNQLEGDIKRKVSVVFDWSKKIAIYKDEERNETIALPPGTFDPLSIFYYVRTLLIKENDLVERSITDGKKCITGRARIIRRERIEVASGSFDTFLLEPQMEHIGGVFEKDKSAKIKLWVSADSRCVPVKIASKVAVGRFVGELVTIEYKLENSYD